MSANSRLTIAAHALAWIGLYQSQGNRVATSEQIASSANTNPVVIRRLLGELRRAGLVESRRGVGAGWSLMRPLESITLLDVYEAVEPGPLFAMHRAPPDQGCVVGFGIQPGQYFQPVTPADIAPTFAALCGITLSSRDGHVLAEALKKPASLLAPSQPARSKSQTPTPNTNP